MKAINGYDLACSSLSLAAIVSALVAPGTPVTYTLLVLAVAVVLASPLVELIKKLQGQGPVKLLMGEGALARILLALTALMMGINNGSRYSVMITGGFLCLLVLG